MMKSINLQSKTDADGLLRVEIPTALKERVVDIIVIYEIENNVEEDVEKSSDWPTNYFSEVYGSLADDPIERLPQGAYPERDQLQ